MSQPSLRTKIIAVLVFTAVLLLCAELLLRLLGFPAYHPVKTHVRSIPEHALIPHPQYGLALNPGEYTVHINEQLQYQATHLADGTRACGATTGDKEIQLYGCSLTYGMGVDDEQSYPALLQKAFPNYLVKNFAVPGYGTLHSLLQLRQQISLGQRPELVILGYSSLHDARNMLTGIQQKYWSETLSTAVHPDMDNAAFPYAQIDKGRLVITSKAVRDFSTPWSFSKKSVLAYRLETAFSNIYYGFNDKYKLSEKIVQEMQRLCAQHEIPFLVLGLDQSNSLIRLKTFAAQQSISLVDASIDLYDPNFNLQPHDAHPNARAHKAYAEQLIRAIGPHFSAKLSMLKK